MKKIIFISIIMMLFNIKSYAFWPFPDVKVDTKIQNLKDSISKSFSDISAKIVGMENKFNGDVSAIKGDVGTLKDNYLHLSMKMDAMAQGQLGFNNKLESIKNDIHSGRDTIQGSNNTNDTGLMKIVVTTMSNGYTYVIGLLIAYVVRLSIQRAKLEGRLMDYINKQEEGQSKYIKTLEAVAFETMGIEIKCDKDGDKNNGIKISKRN